MGLGWSEFKDDSGAVLALLPQDVAAPFGSVKLAAKNEEQVGETVDVTTGGVGQGFSIVQGDHPAFGAPANGAAQVR